MVAYSLPPAIPAAITQSADIVSARSFGQVFRVAAPVFPTLGADDRTLDCTMTEATPTVATRFEIRYSADAQRAMIGHFIVSPRQNDIIAAKVLDNTPDRLELQWSVPDVLLQTWPYATRQTVVYRAIYVFDTQSIFMLQDFPEGLVTITAPQSRGTCRAVP